MIAPISGAGASTVNRRARSRDRHVEPTSASEQGARQRPENAPIAPDRALVANEQTTQRASTNKRTAHLHGDAAFLTHLIATRENLPQTRVRRRAEPEQSVAAYATTARSTVHMSAGRILKHSA